MLAIILEMPNIRLIFSRVAHQPHERLPFRQRILLSLRQISIFEGDIATHQATRLRAAPASRASTALLSAGRICRHESLLCRFATYYRQIFLLPPRRQGAHGGAIAGSLMTSFTHDTKMISPPSGRRPIRHAGRLYISAHSIFAMRIELMRALDYHAAGRLQYADFADFERIIIPPCRPMRDWLRHAAAGAHAISGFPARGAQPRASQERSAIFLAIDISRRAPAITATSAACMAGHAAPFCHSRSRLSLSDRGALAHRCIMHFYASTPKLAYRQFPG